MPKQAIDFNKLARLARFTDNEIIFNLFDSEVESIYESGRHRYTPTILAESARAAADFNREKVLFQLGNEIKSALG